MSKLRTTIVVATTVPLLAFAAPAVADCGPVKQPLRPFPVGPVHECLKPPCPPVVGYPDGEDGPQTVVRGPSVTRWMHFRDVLQRDWSKVGRHGHRWQRPVWVK